LHTRAVDEQMGGISQLRFLETIVRNGTYSEVLTALQKLHAHIVNRKGTISILTADDPASVNDDLSSLLSVIPEKATSLQKSSIPLRATSLSTGIEISSAVNFVGQVWKLDPVTPATTGQLLLMSRILSAGYLWDKVRVEGGAYGGMSSTTTAHPLFSCASYRDPNLAATVSHFKKGLTLVAEGLPQQVLDQNIIGTIGHIDSPLPPHARGFNESIALLSGNDTSFRQTLRDAVFTAKSSDLSKLAQSILDSTTYATTVLGSAAAFDQAKKDGFSCNRESLLPARDSAED
jgi:Zn-dependent M16 (insulinase) family peptidase